jgi:hypothetical protein
MSTDLIQIKIRREDHARLVKFGHAGDSIAAAMKKALDAAEGKKA